MTFADTNIFVYAVGAPHPLRMEAWRFLVGSRRAGIPLCTSAEVLQELAHVFLRVGRRRSFDSAIALISRFDVTVWPLERDDVLLARQLHERHPHLSARDLCHLATCLRRGVSEMMTFDQGLATAFSDTSRP